LACLVDKGYPVGGALLATIGQPIANLDAFNNVGHE
jgi:hypothetical protein